MPEVQEVFRLSTQAVKPDPGALERQFTRQRRRSVGKKLGAFAVAAAIGAAAVALILAARAGVDTTTPPSEPAVNPADPTAEEVATGFFEAFGAFEVERALTYLADDADISGLVGPADGLDGTLDDLRTHLAWLEAGGYELILQRCESAGSFALGTGIRCPFDFHFLRSDEVGEGPFNGSYYDVRVRDGKIVRVSLYWEIEEFSPQMWEPFAQWVSQNHPDDAAVMYEDETYSLERLTEASIRLWERHTRGYAREVAR